MIVCWIAGAFDVWSLMKGFHQDDAAPAADAP
jgi:hypothetical protein